MIDLIKGSNNCVERTQETAPVSSRVAETDITDEDVRISVEQVKALVEKLRAKVTER